MRIPITPLLACVLLLAAPAVPAFYNPEAGRWLNRDPVQELGGINLFAFVNGNPVNTCDRFGLWEPGKQVTCGATCPAPQAGLGHNNFPGGLLTGGPFDYAAEDRDWLHGTDGVPRNVIAWLVAVFTFGKEGAARHFRDYETAGRGLADAVKTCDFHAFESYAHQLQDFFSHYGQGYRWLTFGHAYDTIFRDYPKPDDSLAYFDAYVQAWDSTSKLFHRWEKCCECTAGKWYRILGRPEDECSAPAPENPFGNLAPPPRPRAGPSGSNRAQAL